MVTQSPFLPGESSQTEDPGRQQSTTKHSTFKYKREKSTCKEKIGSTEDRMESTKFKFPEKVRSVKFRAYGDSQQKMKEERKHGGMEQGQD